MFSLVVLSYIAGSLYGTQYRFVFILVFYYFMYSC